MATLVQLPGDMRDAATALDRDVRATMADVDARRDQLSAGTAQGWDLFVQEWAHFTEQDQGPGLGWLYGNGVGAWWEAGSVSMDAINSHRAQLIKWRELIARDTGGLSTPDVEKPPPPTDPLGLNAIGHAIPWVVGGLVVIVGAYFLAPLALRAFKR